LATVGYDLSQAFDTDVCEGHYAVLGLHADGDVEEAVIARTQRIEKFIHDCCRLNMAGDMGIGRLGQEVAAVTYLFIFQRPILPSATFSVSGRNGRPFR
jgi:hypothetical protein